MGQCLSTTLKILVAVNEASQEQQPQKQSSAAGSAEQQAVDQKPIKETKQTVPILSSKLSPNY